MSESVVTTGGSEGGSSKLCKLRAASSLQGSLADPSCPERPWGMSSGAAPVARSYFKCASATRTYSLLLKSYLLLLMPVDLNPTDR